MNNKARILQTALSLFAEQGFDRTPTSQIARAAGVSEGLIFRHYVNKAGLLEALLREGMDQIGRSMEAYGEAGDPRAAVLDHVDRAGALLVEHGPFWRLVHRLRFRLDVEQAAGAAMAAMNRTIVAQLTRNFERMGAADPAAEARLLFAAIDGVAIHYVQDPERFPLKEVLEALKKKY